MGRITAITQVVTDVEGPRRASDQQFEEVEFLFSQMSWTYEIGGVTY